MGFLAPALPWIVGGAAAAGVGKALQPSATKYPDPIDPGEAQTSYIEAMSDPDLQRKQYEAEATYRPQYLELGLADLEGQLFGIGDQQGALGLLGEATPQIGEIQAGALTQQRTGDIADVEALGGRATEALRASDPAMQALIAQQQGATTGAYDREAPTTTEQQRLRGVDEQRLRNMEGDTLGLQWEQFAQGDKLMQQADTITEGAKEYEQGLTPQQERQAAQRAREAGSARGVDASNATIASEILGRENFLAQNRAEARTMRGEAAGLRGESYGRDQYAQGLRGEAAQRRGEQAGIRGEMQGLRTEDEMRRAQAFQEAQGAGGNLFGMLGQTSADPFQAILGRPGMAFGGAQQQQGFGAGMAAQNMGPQLFDPNAGVNLGLMNQANQANYNANIYGSQAGMYGGMMQGLGGIFSSLFPRPGG